MKKNKRENEIAQLALEILLWCAKRGFYTGLHNNLSANSFLIKSQGQSFKTIHEFKKDFKQFGTFERSDSASEGCLDYVSTVKIGKNTITVDFYAVNDLPNTCRLVEEKVFVSEETVPEHIVEEHYETKLVVKCSDDKDQEVLDAIPETI